MERRAADGIYLGLPTMATANAMHARVREMCGRLFAEGSHSSAGALPWWQVWRSGHGREHEPVDEHRAQEAARLGDALARHRTPVLEVFRQRSPDLRRVAGLGPSLRGERLQLRANRVAALLAYLDGLQDRLQRPDVRDRLRVAGELGLTVKTTPTPARYFTAAETVARGCPDAFTSRSSVVVTVRSERFAAHWWSVCHTSLNARGTRTLGSWILTRSPVAATLAPAHAAIW